MRKLILLLTIVLGTVAAHAQSLKGYTLGKSKVKPKWNNPVTVGGVKGFLEGSLSANSGALCEITFEAKKVDIYYRDQWIDNILKHYNINRTLLKLDSTGFKYYRNNIKFTVWCDYWEQNYCKLCFNIADIQEIKKSRLVRKRRKEEEDRLEREKNENDF